MSDKGSGDKQPWLIPIIVAVISTISAVAVALINRPPTPAPTLPQAASSPTPTPTPLSFSDWEGVWDLQWNFEGNSDVSKMILRVDQSGIEGEYKYGTVKGNFVDTSKVQGEYINTAGTGTTCSDGRQTGLFSLNMSIGGKYMNGFWDVCGKGKRYEWKADKRG